ncbi:TonB-dependent receptor [Novosphingobium resinovorum]|uniref:TonB-dependent receptor n=2 Tax=Novosphingobium resinovorum TaxID=158500 RepID=A0A031JKG6_9SPHN|nr:MULTISPECIES: TonB-dependent receptor [Novosphingobium]EZP73195.1 TonB-dependent receptor [Novosphingobium resinovorum]MBF7014351.1 TonB-dependent receptor [Novosphingobium sp. HR1a]WJM25166.1 TonB-dependent receptor [Novosphingobium resinovorum]
MKSSKLLAGVAFIGLVATPGVAMAQDEAASAAQPTAGVGEIIVTAQKRSESLNKVGLTIQALSSDDLVKQGVNSVSDLAKVIPALTVANSIYNTPVYTLRGVGFYENSLAAYPAVSVYVDEVPMPFPALVGTAALDVERVEVLKGPQGTLFGQNATGGAINYIAAKPTADFKAGVNASIDSFGEVDASGFVSGPISDTLRVRVAAKTAQGGAWQKSQTRPDDDKLGDKELYMGRVLLDWTPTDRLSVSLNVNGMIDKSDPQAGQYIALFPQVGPVGAGLAATPFAPSKPRTADWNPNRRPKGDDRQWQAALRADYELSDSLKLTSITSYVDFSRKQVNDPDGVAVESLEFLFDGSLKSFSQELRIASNGSGPFSWIVGGNFEHTTSKEFADQYAGQSSVVANLGFPANTNTFFLNSQIDNYAVFANADYEILPGLTVKGGVRYTKSQRDAQTCTRDAGNGGAAAFFTAVSTQVRQAIDPTAAPTPAIPVGGCVTLDEATFLPTLYEGSLDQDNVSWRGGIDYQALPELLLYANVSKGYKAGSFLFTNASSTAQFAPVTQESVLAFEGGFKASMLDRRMQFNLAGFYYKYTDKQIRGKRIDPVFGVLDALVNVPKSSLMGVEAEIMAEPVDGLNLRLGGTYVDTRIDEYTGVGFNGGVQDFEGNPIPFAPKLSVNGSADYEFALSEGVSAFLGGTATHNSSTYSVIDTVPTAKLKDYTLVDLRAGLSFSDDAYRLTVFANNVTNEYYYTNAPILYDTQVRYTGRPASYGVALAARF